MKLAYATKARLISLALPVAVVAVFSVIGYRATHASFAITTAPTGVSVFTSQPVYHVGDTVSVTIANASPEAVSVANNCPGAPLSVYRQENGSWDNLDAKANIAKCAGEPRNYTIPAVSSVKVSFSDWPSLFSQPGNYMIVANLNGFSNGPSTEFTVTQ